MSATLTNDQITAGAAVLGDDGQPVGRNTAMMVFDAMTVAAGRPTPRNTVQHILHWALGELLDTLPERRDWLNPEAEKVLRAVREAPKAAGADLDLRDLARLFAEAHETGRPVTLSASACGLLFDAMTTAAPAMPLEERQRAGLMANTERKRDHLEQRGYGVIGYVMQGARGDRCTVAQGAVHWQVDPVGASTVLTDERKPFAHVRFRAAQRITAEGDVDANEWYDFCEPGEIGDDKLPAFPLYDQPVAAQAGQVAVPEGWKLVPENPTNSMRYAYERDAVSGRVDIQGYKAMIAAAPSPAKESK